MFGHSYTGHSEWCDDNDGHELVEDFQINDKYSVFDAKGKIVLPSWNDSHTHLVFAGTREKEFIDRINGLSYKEIASRGGGILNSANLLEITSEDDLFSSSSKRLDEVMKMGTGAIEIKSGYGLSLDGELKMLRVIKRLQESYDEWNRGNIAPLWPPFGAKSNPMFFVGDIEVIWTF